MSRSSALTDCEASENAAAILASKALHSRSAKSRASPSLARVSRRLANLMLLMPAACLCCCCCCLPLLLLLLPQVHAHLPDLVGEGSVQRLRRLPGAASHGCNPDALLQLLLPPLPLLLAACCLPPPLLLPMLTVP